MVLAAAGFALGAGSAIAGLMQQRAQNKFLKKQKRQNDLAAATAFANSQQRSQMAKAELRGEKRVADMATAIAARQARGQAKVNAAVSGISGISVENVLVDINRQAGMDLASTEDSLDRNMRKLDMQIAANRVQTENALRTGQVVDMTSDLAGAINVASAGMQGFISGGGFKAKAPTMDFSVQEGDFSDVGAYDPYGPAYA